MREQETFPLCSDLVQLVHVLCPSLLLVQPLITAANASLFLSSIKPSHQHITSPPFQPTQSMHGWAAVASCHTQKVVVLPQSPQLLPTPTPWLMMSPLPPHLPHLLEAISTRGEVRE